MAQKEVNLKVKADPSPLEKLEEKLSDIKRAMQDVKTEEGFKKLEKEAKKTNAEIDEMNKKFRSVDFKPVEQLEEKLKDVRNQMVGLKDADALAKLQLEAGSLQGEIDRVNTTVLTSRSNFTNFNTALAGTAESLLTLDFESANEKAQQLSAITKKMTFKEMRKGLKSATGSIKTMGRAILANPIFLIAAIIIAVGVALFALKDKIAIIGAAFDALTAIIDFVIQKLKDLTDWLGFTSFAAEDNAQREIEAQEKKKDAYVESSNKITNELQRQIKEQQALGKETTKLEKKLLEEKFLLASKELSTTTNQINELLDLQEEKNAKGQELTNEEKEQLKELQEAKKEQKEAYLDAESAMTVFKNKQTKERIAKEKEEEKQIEANAAKAEEDRQKRIEKWREAQKKREAEEKEFAKNRLEAARQMRDLELSLMDEGIEKEIALLNESYKRQIEDIASNESLLAEEKKKLTEQLEAQREKEITAKEEEKNAEELQQRKDQLMNLRDLELQFQEGAVDENDLEKRRELLEERNQLEIDKLREQLQKKQLTKEEFAAQEKLLNQQLSQDKLALDEIEKKSEEEKQAAKKAAQEAVFNDTVSILNSTAALAGENAAIAKVAALAEIAFNTGKAISGAIAAGAGVPFPGNIPAIASGVASVLSGLVSAKQALSSAPPVKGGGGGGGNVSTPSAPSLAAGPQFFGQEFEDSGDREVTGDRQVVERPSPAQAFIVDSDLASSREREKQLEDKVKFQ